MKIICNYLFKLFRQSSEDKGGVWNRVTTLFSKRRRGSRSGSEGTDENVSPQSVHSVDVRQDDDEPAFFSDRRSPSVQSVASIVADGGDLPFADSDSSGSVKAAPIRHPAAKPKTDPVVEASRNLTAYLEEISLTNDGPEVQILKTCPEIPLRNPDQVKKTVLKPVLAGPGGYSALAGVTLAPPTRESTDENMGKKNSQRRRPRKLSGGSGGGPQDSPSPATPSPVQLHKAMWVETHLDEETHDSSSSSQATPVRRSPVPADVFDSDPSLGDSLEIKEKRRSIKLSTSEKFFAKRVWLNSQSSLDGDGQDRGETEATTCGLQKSEIRM